MPNGHRWQATDMLVIGLTGNIATGKSTVMAMLARRGAFAIDADKLVHTLLNRDPAVHRRVVERFGRLVLGQGDAINRAKLGSMVFGHPERMRALEAILHPLVQQRVDDTLASSDASVAVVEAIKLLESSLRDRCDQIWVTTCPEGHQIQRLLERGQLTRQQAIQRVRSQSPQSEKVALADQVIDTSGDREDTERQVDSAWRQVVQSAAAKQAGEGP